VKKKTKNDELNEQQEKFCLEFRRHNGNKKEAAIAAGYSKKSASALASQLLKLPKVQKRIQELAKDAERKTIISIIERQQVLSEIARDPTKEDRDRIRAIDILNKMDGNYLIKLDVNVNVSLAANILAVMANYNGETKLKSANG
jgi:phage terminase small subunit